MKTYTYLKWGKIISLYLPFLFMLILIYPATGHGGDTYCWIEWAKYSFQNGLKNIYKSWTDYLPFYHYILFIYAKIQGSSDLITLNIYKLKIITLLFELGSTLILFRLLENKTNDFYKAFAFSLFYFLNIAVLYNSIIWGQVDGIMSFLVFASVVAAYYKRPFLSVVCFLFSLNFKLQAIIFLPVLLALLIPFIVKIRVKNIVYSALFIALIQLLLILPFILANNLSSLYKVISGSVGKYPVISMNAYNMWYFFIQGNLMEIKDSVKFAGISYKNWGLITFFITGFAACWHLIKSTCLLVFYKQVIDLSLKKILISCSLIPLLFFFFNTQMHERYTHAAYIFIAAYTLLYNRPILLLLASIAYFLNLEDVLMAFNTHNYHTLVYTPWFIAVLYLFVIIWLYLDLFKIKKNLNPA